MFKGLELKVLQEFPEPGPAGLQIGVVRCSGKGAEGNPRMVGVQLPGMQIEYHGLPLPLAMPDVHPVSG